MQLSTQTEVIGTRLGEAKAVKLLCETGFDALDYSMFGMYQNDHVLNQPGYEKHLDQLMSIAASHSVRFNQAHAPFPTYKEHDPEFNKKSLDRIKRSIEAAAYLGADCIVIHPIYLNQPEKMNALNFEIYHQLQPLCEKLNIRIALENLFASDPETQKIIPGVCSTGEAFNAYLDELDRKWFVGCLDLGHCGLVGEQAAAMIRQMGPDRLKALHVHDNDHHQDQHQVPFTGLMDWPAITKALSDIDYSGDLTLEADRFFVKMPQVFLPTAAKFLHDVGRQLIAMINQTD